MPAFYPTRGGIEVLIENLTQRLNVESKFTHTVIAPRVDHERPDDFVFRETKVLSIDTPHLKESDKKLTGNELLVREHTEFARILLKSRQHIQTVRPHLIHIHGLSAIGVTVSTVAEPLKIPVVMHVHGSVGGALSIRMMKQVRTAITVVTVSDFVARSVAQETGRTENVRVIRNALPDPWERIDKTFSVSTDPTITMVGRLEVAKGFDFAFRAAALLKSQYPNLTVNLIGVGDQMDTLQSLAESLGIAQQVIFHGRLEQEATLELIARSTCVVVPSIAFEGFSLVALEAAFLERPVVATNVGGLPETVVDGVTGTIVDSGDAAQLAQAIGHYLSNPVIAREHGQNARKRALVEFSLDRLAREVNEIHVEALTTSPATMVAIDSHRE